MKEWIKDKKECIIFWWYDSENQRAFHLKLIIEHIGFSIIIKILTLDLSINYELPNFFTHYWYNFGYIRKKISKNKFLELQLIFEKNFRTGIDFLKSYHRDHAGIEFNLYVLGFNLIFRIYDWRHWDHENNKWCC